MKPPPFEYFAPTSLEEATSLASRPNTRFLAGGQSLMPLLNMRLTHPEALIDLNRVEGLATVAIGPEGKLRLGAMVRQRTLEVDPSIRQAVPVLAEAASHIAHLPIRTRGTIGGSLAHADPAAELPATMALLGADLHISGPTGDRVQPASTFFTAPFTTGLRDGEILTGVEISSPPAGTGWAFLEVTRTHGAFALVGVAALIASDGDVITFSRLALFGVGGVPYVPDWASSWFPGRLLSPALVAEAASRVADEIAPLPDIHAGVDYRRRVAAALTRRALTSAAGRAR
jgi:carbon-monoxide dehydrogenase medium subunit